MCKRNFIYPISILVILTIFLTGCREKNTPVSRTGFYFDTVATITLYQADDFSNEHCQQLFADCFALCGHYEALFSRTKEDSDIWKINHAGGNEVKVSYETIDLLKKALKYCEAVDGAADITIAPISSLWNFSSERINSSQDVPDRKELQQLLPHVNYKNIKINESASTVILSDPDASIDLGCIAKGYIADRLKTYLTAHGVTSALINLGGNTLAIGSRPDQTPFRLGIQKPFSDVPKPFAVVSVTDASLVSSGIYERCFEKDGILYHHLLNTKTGMPENNGLLSVTILSDSSADGDMLSTACFLLGLQKGMAFAESLPGIEAVFITEDYALHPTSGISSLLNTP